MKKKTTTRYLVIFNFQDGTGHELEKKVQDRSGNGIPSGPVPKRLAPRSDVQMAGGPHYVTIKMVVKVSGFFNFLLFLPILSVSFYIMMGKFDLAGFLQFC